MRDLAHNIAVRSAIAPAVQAASVDGAVIDTFGFNSVAFAISTGDIAGSGSFTAKVQDSDDGVTFADAPADRLHGSVPAAFAASSTLKVGYVGYKRYVRLGIAKTSGTSIALGAIAILSDAAQSPVA